MLQEIVNDVHHFFTTIKNGGLNMACFSNPVGLLFYYCMWGMVCNA
jgi:hypothetical protein